MGSLFTRVKHYVQECAFSQREPCENKMVTRACEVNEGGGDRGGGGGGSEVREQRSFGLVVVGVKSYES